MCVCVYVGVCFCEIRLTYLRIISEFPRIILWSITNILIISFIAPKNSKFPELDSSFNNLLRLCRTVYLFVCVFGSTSEQQVCTTTGRQIHVSQVQYLCVLSHTASQTTWPSLACCQSKNGPKNNNIRTVFGMSVNISSSHLYPVIYNCLLQRQVECGQVNLFMYLSIATQYPIQNIREHSVCHALLKKACQPVIQ